jgi:hypothetical protein
VDARSERLKRRIELPDRREATIAAVLIGWLGLIGVVENTGSTPGVRDTITCRIVSVSITDPASCRPHGLGRRPLALTGGAIRLDRGRRMRIVPGNVSGSVDSSLPGGKGSSGYAEIRGWAASLATHRPADAVLVFSSEHFVGAIRPRDRRPDVAHALRAGGLDRSGYTLRVPLALLGDRQPTPRLQLFAVDGGAASPLPFNCAQTPKPYGC